MATFDRATERYFALLEQLQQAVIVTDQSGTVIRWSSTAEALYGWTSAEALHQNVVDLTPADFSREEAEEIMRTLSAGQVWSGKFSVRARDGRSFAAWVADVPLLDDRHRIVGIVGASAAGEPHVRASAILLRFASACEAVWPGRVRLDVERAPRGSVLTSEPHVLQLLSLLTIRYADALEGDGVLDFFVGDTDSSAFADFDFDWSMPAVYLRITERDSKPKYSLLRDEIRSPQPSNFAASLVRSIQGSLLVEVAPQGQIIHLLLPVEQEEPVSASHPAAYRGRTTDRQGRA